MKNATVLVTCEENGLLRAYLLLSQRYISAKVKLQEWWVHLIVDLSFIIALLVGYMGLFQTWK
jgi:hypothetical protein